MLVKPTLPCRTATYVWYPSNEGVEMCAVTIGIWFPSSEPVWRRESIFFHCLTDYVRKPTVPIILGSSPAYRRILLTRDRIESEVSRASRPNLLLVVGESHPPIPIPISTEPLAPFGLQHLPSVTVVREENIFRSCGILIRSAHGLWRADSDHSRMGSEPAGGCVWDATGPPFCMMLPARAGNEWFSAVAENLTAGWSG